MLHIYLGWLSAIILSLCGVPQAIKTWRTKKADDLSALFIIMWLSGEVLVLVYIVYDDILNSMVHWPLYVNYMFNIIVVTYLLVAKVSYKK